MLRCTLVFAAGLMMPGALDGAAQSSVISTVAGPALPVDGAPAVTQMFDQISAVAPDRDGGVYLASHAQNRVYHVSPDGALTLFAGSSYGFSGDGGRATSARLAGPTGLGVDARGNVYIGDTNNNCVRKVTPEGVITTFAGSGTAGFSGDGGPAAAARLSSPHGIAFDAAGNVFIADGGNGRVRKVTPDGMIQTVFLLDGGPTSGNEGPVSPFGVAVDASGNLYIADNLVIRRVSADGVSSIVVPTKLQGRFNQICVSGGDGGPAASASVCYPLGVAVDSSGNVFIADRLKGVRRITPDGRIDSIAALDNPFAVAVDSAGNLYAATELQVHKLPRDGAIRPIAGTLSPALVGTGAGTDAAGNLYSVDTANHRVLKTAPNGTTTTIAGDGTAGFAGDGGPAVFAKLNAPSSLHVDTAGNIYIADRNNGAIRKITVDGVISTVAGSPDTNCTFNSSGAPLGLCSPQAVVVDSVGNLFVANSTSIRKVDTHSVMTTIAGDATLSLQTPQLIPYRLALDRSNNLYFTDHATMNIRKLTPDGVMSTFAGNTTCAFGGDGGPATSAALCYPEGIAFDAAGNLYVADASNYRIRKITPAGVITTFAGNGVFGFSGDGGLATSAQLSDPTDVALDQVGNLYIYSGGRIRKAAPAATTRSYTIADFGADYWATTTNSGSMTIGYGRLQTARNTPAPYGIAVFGFRSNGVLVSEAAVPGSAPIQAGRVFVEASNNVRTGVAIANPNDQNALISFYFTDKDGVNFKSDATTLPPHEQLSAFLDEPLFGGSAQARAFTFTSSAPVGAVALRGTVNERGEFLMTTLPIAPTSSTSTDAVILPHFAAGGGWVTQILLVNPTDELLTGRIDADGTTSYAIAPRSAMKIVLPNIGTPARTGTVRITPASGSRAPVASSVFTFVSGGITVTESGVASATVAQSFRVFAEFDSAQSMQTGVAIANLAPTPATVHFDLRNLNGQLMGYSGSITIDANGHRSLFLNEIPGLQNLPSSFRGVLRISSDSSISAIGIRARYNERNDFLISTTPAVAENALPLTSDVIFPQIVTGGGYTTEFVFLSFAGAAEGTVVTTTRSGLELPFQYKATSSEKGQN